MAYYLSDRAAESPADLDAEIRRRTRMSLDYFAHNPAEIDRRLEELDAEPSVERALQVATAGTSLAGFLFAATRSRVWLLLPMVAAGLSLQQAIGGRSKSQELVRKFGFRTNREIERERFALRSLRGDAGEDDAGPSSPRRVPMPENVGRSSDALPSRSASYVE